MEYADIVFVVWCMGIHCLLFALIDSTSRVGLVTVYNKLRWR